MAENDLITGIVSNTVWSLNGDAPPADIYEELMANIAQLRAQILCITGEGFEAFDNLNGYLKGNVLWALESQAQRIDLLAQKLPQNAAR